MRVLHIVHWSNGGVSKVAQALCRHGDGLRSKLVVLEHNGGEIDSRLDYAIIGKGSPLKTVRQLRRIIREFQPQVIHAHSITPLLFAVMLAPARTILVRTIHNQYPHFRATDLRSRGKRTLESALHTLGRVSLVSVSPAVSASLPWAAKRHCVIHNGVSFDRVAALAGEAHPRSSTSADTIVMVCMGRLEQQKNFPLLLRSFALCVRRTQHPLLLWILGEGSDRRRLEQDAQQLGIAHLVQFLGHRDNPFPWVASADIYVSTSEYEGLSLALIEAMGLGLPVVTTRSGGVTDSLATGGDLLIVEQHEAEPFADAVMSLVEDETLRRRVAHQGMSTARSCYSLDQMLVAYGNLYRNITAGIA